MMRVPYLIAAAAAVCVPHLAAQRNCTQLSRYDPGGSFNDIWGYHEPATGREMALLGSTTGTYFVETTNPTSPVRKAFIAGPRSTWRDIKVFGQHAYIVTEGGGGMQIVDLSSFDTPTLVTTFDGGWTHAHNIAMDLQLGIAVVVGTSSGDGYTYFFDIKTNPTSPQLITRWYGPYQHDVSMQNGLLHGAEIYGGYYAIYDVSKLPAVTLLGNARTPHAFTHNTWPSYDDRFCVTTDERSGGGVTLYDITNRAAPKQLDFYHAGGSQAIPHNAYIRDYVVHVASYSEGYRCLDISDEQNLVEVAYLDTHTSSSGFNGAWGCYHLQPSGNIYISDISNGLFVLKPKSTSTRYGTGTPGTGNKLPHVHTIGSAYLGNKSFKLGVRDALANTVGVLLLGGTRANGNAGGLMIHVDLVSPPPFITAAATNASGALLQPLPIPTDPQLAGVTVDVQYLVLDPGGKLGFASSEGLEFELFNK